MDERSICGVFFAMTLQNLSETLSQMGCPPEKASEMAAQLDRRARQLSELPPQRTYDEALLHLLALMRQGWAAKDRLG